MGTFDKKRGDPSDAASSVGILGLVGRFARQLPGAEYAEEQLQSIEARAMRELKQRLESIDDRRLPAPEHPVSGGHHALFRGPHPRSILAGLLAEADDQTAEQARLSVYSHILSQLVPDEARLLGALSDGVEHPLLHVGIGPPFGTPRPLAENFSNLGKTASLKLKERTPKYITHMRSLELLEEGPEDKEQDIKYQILESDKGLREVTQAAEKGTAPGIGVRYIRRVIRIAPLGEAIWQTCQPTEVDNQ